MKVTGNTLIVFADLDGTLLDHDTYSYEESLEGVRLLKEKGIPLVLVSSKSRIEMEELHKKISLHAPFIFENGGGIATPRGRGYSVEYMSVMTLQQVRTGISEVRRITAAKIVTMEEMDVDELAGLTGLSTPQAVMARKREASMPIVFRGDISGELSQIREILAGMSLQMITGGRFYHVLPYDVDKGKAVAVIRERCALRSGTPSPAAAIGDGMNDIPMLLSVDIPCLVRKKDGNYIDSGINDILVTEAAGPAGFTEAVHMILLEKC